MIFSQSTNAENLADDLTGNNYYLQFRRQIANFALAELVSLLKTSSPYILGVLGPALMALVALLCIPLLYACTLNSPSAVLLIATQAVVMAIPAWLLNKCVLPTDVLAFFRPLPVGWATHIKADAAAAWLVLRPLGLAYILSMGIWLWHFPKWIQSIWLEGMLVTIVSFAITWLLVILGLQLRWYPVQLPRLGNKKRAAGDFSQKIGLFGQTFLTSSKFLLCYHLLWLPLWRKDGGVVGRRQALLLAGAFVAIYFWMMPTAKTNVHVWLAVISTVLIITMTTLGNAALLKNLVLFNPVLTSLPFSTTKLEFSVKLLAIVPAYLALAVFSIIALHLTTGQISLKIALIYVVLATLFLFVISVFTLPNTTARTAVVALSLVVLSAIGSTLWL